MGIIVGDWAAYLWKERMSDHARVAHASAAFAIADDDEAVFPYDGGLFDTFELNMVMACFCIRRMAEKRLITDALDGTTFSFWAYPPTGKLRPPFPGMTSNGLFRSYDFTKPEKIELTLRDFANEVIHSSNLGIVSEGENPPVGIVVASDLRLKKRLLYLSLDDWDALYGAVHRDAVAVSSDSWDPNTGRVHAKRQGPHEM